MIKYDIKLLSPASGWGVVDKETKKIVFIGQRDKCIEYVKERE